MRYSRRAQWRQLADGADRRSGCRHLRRRLPGPEFREHEPRQHALDQAVQPVRPYRYRRPALSRLREMVGRPRPAQCRGDAVDRRQSVRRQQAGHRRDRHQRRYAPGSAQHQVADHLLLLAGRRHHAAAAGAGLDPRPLRDRRRHPRQRPDHRLLRARQDRPSRHLRVRRRGEEGACRVRQQHRLHRLPAARPVRGGADAGGRRGEPRRVWSSATMSSASSTARSMRSGRSAPTTSRTSAASRRWRGCPRSISGCIAPCCSPGCARW